MKQFKITFVLTLLMSMVGLQAFAAYDTSTKVNVGTLYYYLDRSNNLAEVTSMPSGNYTGDIEIPSSITYAGTNYDVTSIGDKAFAWGYGLTSVTIPNSVTSIGEYAFSSCSGLTSVTIGNSVTSIEKSAFVSCKGLTSVTIPNSVTSIGREAFYGCSGLTSITIGNSVTSIGDYAFLECSGLTSVTIPNSVTSIGSSAFRGCSSLTSITIGSGVKIIGGSTFASCPELTDVTCYAENVPSTETTAFKDSYIEYATLHVPASAVNAYKAADPWKNFKNIIEANPTGIKAIENTQTKNTTIYDMNGVRLSEPKKGINIINGKKVVIK